MFWIVHLFALLLFWPALFLTVPLHIIAGRIAPKPATPKPPPLPTAPGSDRVPDSQVVGILLFAALMIYGMYKLGI